MFFSTVTKWLTKYQSKLLGIVIYEVSFLLGYWDVDWSLPVFIIDRGVLTGIATGQQFHRIEAELYMKITGRNRQTHILKNVELHSMTLQFNLKWHSKRIEMAGSVYK